MQPTASDIAQGEIAINLADLRMFTKDHNNAIQRIGGEDVRNYFRFYKWYFWQMGHYRVYQSQGSKWTSRRADGTLTTFNIFQQMMLFSLFQGHFVSRAVFNTHQHTDVSERLPLIMILHHLEQPQYRFRYGR